MRNFASNKEIDAFIGNAYREKMISMHSQKKMRKDTIVHDRIEKFGCDIVKIRREYKNNRLVSSGVLDCTNEEKRLFVSKNKTAF